MARKQTLSTIYGRQQRIHGLAEAALQIEREAQSEEVSNYFEVLRYFQNPPDVFSDPENVQ
jgi:hypothetical protein